MEQEKNDARPYACGKHNQQIILFDPTKKENLCLVCVQQMAGLIPFNQSLENYKKLFNFSNNENDNNIQQFQNLLKVIQNYKQKLVGDIDEIIEFISDQIKQQISFKQRLQRSNELNFNQQPLISELELECLNQNQINHEVKIQLSTKLEDLKNQYSKIDDLLEGLNGKRKQTQLKQLNNQKKYEYQLIKESIKKEERECSLFAFNQENTILVIVKRHEQKMDHQILVYEFKNGQIIGEPQVLNDHFVKINCLYFMKLTNSFISGNNDKSIIFWELDQTNHWIAKKQMKQNSGIVNILMNEKEDLLILNTFSECGPQKYGQISFLTKISENWICQDVIEKDRNMIEMSLDNKGNKLIALGDGLFGTKPKVIYIFEKQKEKWVKSQQLIVNQNGCGLQFINNNAFVLQSTDEEFLEIFQFNQDLKTFKKAQQQEVQRCANLINFPCQFIQDLNFLTVKHGNYFNVFQADKEGNLQIIQTIQFYGNRIFGRVSDNGEYLIAWDETQKEIQVRKLKKIK